MSSHFFSLNRSRPPTVTQHAPHAFIQMRTIKLQLQWGRYYMRAVVEDEDSWHLGWRMEDLAQQAANQRARMAFLLEVLEDLPAQKPDTNDALRRASLAKVLSEEEDLNRVVSLGCATRPGKFVQVWYFFAVVKVVDCRCCQREKHANASNIHSCIANDFSVF